MRKTVVTKTGGRCRGVEREGGEEEVKKYGEKKPEDSNMQQSERE
jgi:hypothetical protein